MEKDVMEANKRIAEKNRKILAEHSVRAFDVLG
jgi:coenzyme F420-reducing hydrogenase alpha subunit